MKHEYEMIRRIMRGYVREAWREYQTASAGEFTASDNTLALYSRYQERLQMAARLLNCNIKQAAACLNISEV